jgi:hypothetical protein
MELKKLFSNNAELFIILYSDKPKTAAIAEYCFKSIVMEIRECTGESVFLTVENDSIQDLISKYHRTVVYIAAVSANTEGSDPVWTSTYAEEYNNL